ncbi:MAG: YtxH domain-containing protein [Bacteroidota bacterium]
MNSSAKTILGIIAAGAVGVAVGMLLAPKKGSELRESIKGSIDDLGDQLGDFITEGKEKLMGVADELKTHTNNIKKEVKNGSDHVKTTMS